MSSSLLDFLTSSDPPSLPNYGTSSCGPDKYLELLVSQITYADMGFSKFWFTFRVNPRPERWGLNSGVTNCQLTAKASHMAHFFNQPSAMLSHVAHLKLYGSRANPGFHPDSWLQLFCQLSAIWTLHISREFSTHVAHILKTVIGEMVVEALPVLNFIYIGGLPVSYVEKFLVARWISGQPMTIVGTEVEFYKRVNSYIG